jgi:hypothetical protein
MRLWRTFVDASRPRTGPRERPSFPASSIKRRAAGRNHANPNLIYFNEVDRGGHFAAWKQPQLCAEEIRAAFRSLR